MKSHHLLARWEYAVKRRFRLNPVATSVALKLIVAVLCVPVTVLAQSSQSTTTQFQYDANGNLTQITDPLQQVTNQLIDPLNRVQQQQQPAPVSGAARPTMAYNYDGRDQLSSVTDPRSLVTRYTVDGLGNQNSLASPDSGATQRTFDLGGNLTSSTDGRNQTTTYAYDVLNRMTTATYGSGTRTAVTTTFDYDGGAAGAPNAIGHLTRMIDQSGDTRYDYNGFGQVLNKVQYVNDATVAFTLRHSYGNSSSSSTYANGKLLTLTYPSGNQITYQYDATGRISDLTLNSTDHSGTGSGTVSIPLLTKIGYQPFGAPVSWTWGNSSATSVNTYARSIDTDGRITSFPLGSGVNNGTLRTLTYDAASRITAMTHSGTGIGTFAPANFDRQFGYDNLNRLISVTGGGTGSASSNQTFSSDATGNRTALTLGGSAYTNVISPSSNRLISTTGPAPAKTNQYDAAGNLVNDGTTQFTFNARGRRASASIGTSTITYVHNGFGQRILKSGTDPLVPSGQQQYVYDEAGHLIGEYDASGTMIQETVYLGDMPVAVLTQSIDTTGPILVTSTNAYYLYADQINTPRVITQASDNQIVWRWDATDPFGVLPSDEDPSGLGAFTYNPRFPGQLYDPETNLHYNGYRDYDPLLGRYTQSDPNGLNGGINTYAYVGGNPVSFVDQLGLKGLMLGGRPWDPPVHDNGSSCGPLFQSPMVDEDGCINPGNGGPKICIGPEALKGVGSTLAGLTAAELKAMMGPGGVNAWRDLFGSGTAGAERALQNAHFPTAFTNEAAAAYKELANRALANYETTGNAAGAALQNARLEILKRLGF